jgi:membrane protein DedA with SNARE-associated domain/rhodanese-related sulfurtransferase
MQTAIFLLERYGLLAIFLNVLFSAGGLPLPCYPMLMLAAALAGPEEGRIAEIVATGASAALIADLGWFWSGRRYGHRVLKRLCRISLSPDSCVRRTESVFSRVGPAALPISKFIPGLSNVSVVIAGGSGISLPTFLAFDALGAVLFIGTGVALGAVFRHAISSVLASLAAFGTAGLAALIAGLAIYLLWKWNRRQIVLRQLRMDRISVVELRNLIARGARPLILDVRSAEARGRDGYIPGSVGASLAQIEEATGLADFDRHVVLYCACPAEASAAMGARRLKELGFRKANPLLGGIDAWVEAGFALDGVCTKTIVSNDDDPCLDASTAAALG